MLDHVAIALCAAILEAGWIASVRFVTSKSRAALVMSAVLMQGISYTQTLILVHDNWAAVSGMLGAALGGLIGMFLPERWFQDNSVD